MRKYAIFGFLIIAAVSGCTEKKFVSSEIMHLNYSVDTVYFDTVFTTIGTATNELRVVNPNKGWLRIDNISINSSSSFRLNIDGHSSNDRQNIDIAPGDSIFIFVDVLVDPSNSDNPVAINDSIVFNYHGIDDDINLLAWGQDINLINGEVVSSTTWSGNKPYVVYNSMMVGKGEVLNIDEGVRVYFHRGSTMWVAGTLNVTGTVESPVVFSSDRYESIYNDIPGQWEGIGFLNGSSANTINYAIIKNSISALHLGYLGSSDPAPDLHISNSTILHNTVSGISSIGSSIKAVNCVISHCGFYSLYLVMGGEYEFIHCTINNFWDYSVRYEPGVVISDYIRIENVSYNNSLIRSDFTNSIIYGSLRNEVAIYSYDNEILNCNFISCLLKLDHTSEMLSDYDFQGNIVNLSPGFISTSTFDFRPDTLSPLIDIANRDSSLVYDMDIRGFSRFNDLGPDIGAYERQIGETSNF